MLMYIKWHFDNKSLRTPDRFTVIFRKSILFREKQTSIVEKSCVKFLN